MRGKQVRLFLIAAGLGVTLVACAPAGPATPATTHRPTVEVAGDRAAPAGAIVTPSPAVSGARAATAGTPVPADVQSIQQQLRDLHRDLLQVHRQLPQVGPERRQQVAPLMADLMDEMSQFMVLMQPAVDQMTPEEQQAAANIVQRMHADIRQMQRVMPGASPMAGTPGPWGRPGAGPMGRQPTPGTAPMMAPRGTPGAGPMMSPQGTPGSRPAAPTGPVDMEWMHQQMGETHQQMLTHMQQLGPQEVDAMVGHMADLTDDMSQLIDLMGPALGRISPEERQALRQQLDRMQDTVREMMRVTGPMPGTPSPSPAQGPGA